MLVCSMKSSRCRHTSSTFKFEQDSSGIRQRDFLEKAVDALKFKLSLDKKNAQAQIMRIMQVCKRCQADQHCRTQDFGLSWHS